jgi:protein-tyrosine phosphatase
MIDIHCHLLPGVDDGPAEESTSVAMCRLAAEHGTTDLVATPHANARYDYSPERNLEMLQRLQEAVGPAPRLYPGCDFRLTYDNITAALAEPKRFTIAGGPYLLVEFSDQVISQGTSEVFVRLRERGVVPVITHPERNPILREHHSRLAVWVERGCLIQVTGQSLLGGFGERSREAAVAMLDARLVHVIASDGHDLEKRPPVLSDCFALVVDRWGEAAAQRLFVTHPQAILEGRGVETGRARRGQRKKWWEFWK